MGKGVYLDSNVTKFTAQGYLKAADLFEAISKEISGYIGPSAADFGSGSNSAQLASYCTDLIEYLTKQNHMFAEQSKKEAARLESRRAKLSDADENFAQGISSLSQNLLA
ncbi:MAG: hypothetical protein ACRC35_03000 [Angustibacter sp.]